VKVIFLEDIPDVAMAGQVKEVKPGYARNFLLPKGLAALATADQLQRQKKLLAAAEKRHQDLLSEAQKQAEKLEGLALTVVARVGERGKLYGSVTSAEVCTKIQETTGLEIDRHKVLLGQPIKELGAFPIAIRLAPEVKVTVNLSVVGEAPKEAAGAPAAAAEEASAAEAEAEAAKEPTAAQE
jgi:large subunit ribosomal protein L9